MNQIPFYIKTLEESETAIHEKITLEFLKRLYFAHEKGWMDLKYRVTPSLTGLLKTLDATQINELQENLELQEKEMAEKYINKPPDQLINERVERMIDRLEYWIGDLTKEQQQIVVNWSHQVKLVSSQWAVTREEWQYNFIDIVRKSRGKPEFNSLMLDHFQNSRKYWPKGYKESYYHNIDRTLEMFVQIGAILSQQQKQDLLENINDLKKQMQDIYKKT